MGVREFTDEGGRAWRAWEIRPEAIHPQTKAEDYLAGCYGAGWIVFETTDGRVKRRLCPFPSAWATIPEEELLQLLGRADAVPAAKVAREREATTQPPAPPRPSPRRRPGDSTPMAVEAVFDVTDLEVIRSFRYPGGGLWSVSVVAHPDGGGGPVLRFTAGARSIDLRKWPRDWPDYPDERLVDLLRLAAPRRNQSPPPPGTPRRRFSDLQA